MIIGKITGKPVHLVNCTYCALRHNKNIGTKSRKKIQERCLLHQRQIPPPHSNGKRKCDDFVKINCTCEECLSRYKRFDVETLLDKKDKLW